MSFTPNLAGIRELGAAPLMVNAVLHVAEGIRDNAREIATGAFEHPTGEYVAKLSAQADVEDGVATGHAIAADDAAVYIEFGTIDTPTFGIMRRAAETYRF